MWWYMAFAIQRDFFNAVDQLSGEDQWFCLDATPYLVEAMLECSWPVLETLNPHHDVGSCILITKLSGLLCLLEYLQRRTRMGSVACQVG